MKQMLKVKGDAVLEISPRFGAGPVRWFTSELRALEYLALTEFYLEFGTPRYLCENAKFWYARITYDTGISIGITSHTYSHTLHKAIHDAIPYIDAYRRSTYSICMPIGRCIMYLVSLPMYFIAVYTSSPYIDASTRRPVFFACLAAFLPFLEPLFRALSASSVRNF